MEYQTDRLFESWRANGVLHSFLNHIQNNIRSITIISFQNQVTLSNHLQIIIKFKSILQIFPSMKHYLQMLNENSYIVIRITLSNQIICESKKDFPKEILPSIDSQMNPLSDIDKHFKTDLQNS